MSAAACPIRATPAPRCMGCGCGSDVVGRYCKRCRRAVRAGRPPDSGPILSKEDVRRLRRTVPATISFVGRPL